MNIQEAVKALPKFQKVLILVALGCLITDGLILGLGMPRIYEKAAEIQSKVVKKKKSNTIKAGTRVTITETGKVGTIMATRSDSGPFEVRILQDAKTSTYQVMQFFKTEFEPVRRE